MDNYISFIGSHYDDAFFALLAVIVIQVLMIVLSYGLKKSLYPMSFLEMGMRPFVIDLVDRLNRNDRTRAALLARGLIVTSIIMIFLYSVIWSVTYVFQFLSIDNYKDVLLLTLIMSPLALIPLGLDISRNKKPLKGAFQFLAQSLHQNLIPSDHHGLRRNVVTLISTAYIHWVIAPIVIYIMAGIYGAYAYFGLTILIKSIPNPAGVFSYIPFVIFIIIERVLSFFGLVLLCLTSMFSPATRIGFALKGLGYKEKMTEAGFAFTHSIVLGGPIHNRHGDTVPNEWIGASGATAKLQHKDCVRVIIHYSITLFVFVSVLLALMLYAS